MKRMLKLSLAYLRYYKKQTFSLFLGVLLSAALLGGIGSLLYSGRQQNIEKARQDYGDWHYYFQSDEQQLSLIHILECRTVQVCQRAAPRIP